MIVLSIHKGPVAEAVDAAVLAACCSIRDRIVPAAVLPHEPRGLLNEILQHLLRLVGGLFKGSEAVYYLFLDKLRFTCVQIFFLLYYFRLLLHLQVVSELLHHLCFLLFSPDMSQLDMVTQPLVLFA